MPREKKASSVICKEFIEANRWAVIYNCLTISIRTVCLVLITDSCCADISVS